jgi:Predicted membrane protein
MVKLENIVPLLLFVVFIAIAFIGSIRTFIARIMDLVLSHLIDTFTIPFYIMILFMATFTALTTALIQKYTIDYDNVGETEEELKEFQRRYWEIVRSKDADLVREMEAKQKELTRRQLELSLHQCRPIGYILVVTLPVFFWFVYRLNIADELIVMPFFGTLHLTYPMAGPIPVWFVWYIICSFGVSYIVRKTLNIG